MYLIDTPPPTISGNLHIGHMFSYLHGEIAARWAKYQGLELLYPFCFDNNGIPTGKLAANRGIRGQSEIIDFSIEKSKEYKLLFNAAQIEFSENSYYTFDSNAISIAYQAFEKLKSLGIAYKAEAQFLWSDKLQTSISQSELDEEGLIERTGEQPIIKTGIGWFIDIKSHLDEITEKIHAIEWLPNNLKKRIEHWIAEIQWDWSISRNRNFGIPIPGEDGMTFDTWFISALSPQMAWCSYTQKPSLECPIFDLRFQSHDIIRTWAFYTIAMSHFLNDQIPWKRIMIAGHALDSKGDKQSKSKGNAINPQHYINQYGATGLTHWAISNTLGLDSKIDIDKMKMGWKMKNKFQNASKFIDMQIEKQYLGSAPELWDSYLIHKNNIIQLFDTANYSAAILAIYDFFWNEFCGKWIEDSKQNSSALTLKKILLDFEPLFSIIYK